MDFGLAEAGTPAVEGRERGPEKEAPVREDRRVKVDMQSAVD
jgi:hypothetical protein